jgi:hypothetical protein
VLHLLHHRLRPLLKWGQLERCLHEQKKSVKFLLLVYKTPFAYA